MQPLQERSRALRPGTAGSLAVSVLPLLAVLGIAALMHFVVNPLLESAGAQFIAKVVLDIGIAMVLAVSLTMVNGFTGQFSIGHAAFMAVGAYTAAAIVYYTSFRLYGNAYVHGGLVSSMLTGREAPLVTGADGLFLGALLAGGLLAAVCGYVVGLPSLRLKGDYLAIVTLGFGEIVRVLLQAQTTEALAEGGSVSQEHLDLIPQWRGTLTTDDYITAEAIAQAPVYVWPKYLGGALGFSGLPSYNNLFWVFLFAGLTMLVAYRIKQSSYGRAFLSIREDEIAAEAMGVDTTKYKVRAFVIAAFFAGIGGGLYAHTVGVQLSPAELGFQKSFDIIIMVVLGGMGSISGAALAAAILTILPELLRQPPSLWPWGWVVIAGLVTGLFMGVRSKRTAVRVTVGVMGAGLVWEGLRFAATKMGINLSEYRMVLYALALILMMILRPQGLFGVHEVWERATWSWLRRKPA